MNQRTRTALQDIIAGAQTLREYGFTEHAVSIGRGFRASQVNDQEWEIEFDLPDNLLTDASVRTLRLFLLYGEDYSFHRLDRLSADPQLSAEYSAALLLIRRSYFDFLNSSPPGIESGFFEDGSDPTRGEILDVVLNGALFHTRDSPERRRYRLWTRDGIRAGVLLQEFTQIMVFILGLIDRLFGLSEAELNTHLESDGSG
jgi:hypothetical protein